MHGLKQVVLMAGSIYAGYNTGGAIPNPTPSAEWNVVSAPKALADLLQVGIPIRLFPARFDADQIRRGAARPAVRLRFAHHGRTDPALSQWRFSNDWGQITPTLFDVVPVAWLLQPGLCALSPLRIAVDAKGYTKTRGGRTERQRLSIRGRTGRAAPHPGPSDARGSRQAYMTARHVIARWAAVTGVRCGP